MIVWSAGNVYEMKLKTYMREMRGIRRGRSLTTKLSELRYISLREKPEVVDNLTRHWKLKIYEVDDLKACGPHLHEACSATEAYITSRTADFQKKGYGNYPELLKDAQYQSVILEGSLSGWLYMSISHHCINLKGKGFLEKHGFAVEWNQNLDCEVEIGSRQVMNHVVTLPNHLQGVSKVCVAINGDDAFGKGDADRGSPGVNVFFPKRDVWIHALAVFINENNGGRLRDWSRKIWRRLKQVASEGETCAPGYADFSTSRWMTAGEYTTSHSMCVSTSLVKLSSALNSFGADAYDMPFAGVDAILGGECTNFGEYFEAEFAKELCEDKARGAISIRKAPRAIFIESDTLNQEAHMDTLPADLELSRNRNGDVGNTVSSSWVSQNAASDLFGVVMMPGISFEVLQGLAIKLYICEVNQVDSFNFLGSDRDCDGEGFATAMLSIPQRAIGMTEAHRPHSGTGGLGKDLFDEERDLKDKFSSESFRDRYTEFLYHGFPYWRILLWSLQPRIHFFMQRNCGREAALKLDPPERVDEQLFYHFYRGPILPEKMEEMMSLFCE